MCTCADVQDTVLGNLLFSTAKGQSCDSYSLLWVSSTKQSVDARDGDGMSTSLPLMIHRINLSRKCGCDLHPILCIEKQSRLYSDSLGLKFIQMFTFSDTLGFSYQAVD